MKSLFSPAAERLMKDVRVSEPMGYVDGVNRYQMELGNPTKYVDPEGLEAWEHKNNWAEKDKEGKDWYQKYREWLQTFSISDYADKDLSDKRGRQMCTAISVSTLTDFAEKHGLPITFQDPTGKDVSSFAEVDKNTFEKKVFGTGKKDLKTGTTDFGLVYPDTMANPQLKNTELLDKDRPLMGGDILNATGNSQHTVIVKLVEKGDAVICDLNTNTRYNLSKYLADHPDMKPRRWHPNVFKPKPTVIPKK